MFDPFFPPVLLERTLVLGGNRDEPDDHRRVRRRLARERRTRPSGNRAGRRERLGRVAPDESRDVVCGTCGSCVEWTAISERIDDLRAVVEEKQTELADLEERIDELADERRTLAEHRNRRDKLDWQLQRTEQKIRDRKSGLDDLESTAADLRDRILDLEASVAETEASLKSDLLETYEPLSDLEYERGQLEKELDEIESKIATEFSMPHSYLLVFRDDGWLFRDRRGPRPGSDPPTDSGPPNWKLPASEVRRPPPEENNKSTVVIRLERVVRNPRTLQGSCGGASNPYRTESSPFRASRPSMEFRPGALDQ